MKLREFVRVLGAGVLLFVGVNGASALAAPSLIVLQDGGETHPVQRQVSERLRDLIVLNNLGRVYDHVDLLKGSDATRERLFAQIRKRGAKKDVDVVILTSGDERGLSLSSGRVSEREIRAEGTLPRLRFVYMSARQSSLLGRAWLEAGARTVVAHQEYQSLPGFFYPRFLRLWSEGLTARESAERAYRFAEKAALETHAFLKDGKELLLWAGAAGSEPVVLGQNIDRFGKRHDDRFVGIAPLREAQSLSALNLNVAPSGRYAHSDFEEVAIRMLGAILPQASLEPSAIPSAQGLIDQVHGLAWEQLRDTFPHPMNEDLIPGVDLPKKDGEQLWIDGEALRYLLGQVPGDAGALVGPYLDRIQGLRLTRQGDQLKAAIYFDRAFRIPVIDESKAKRWSPYAVHVPKTVRFSIRMKDGVLRLLGLDQDGNAVNLKLKMPFLPDTVWVRHAILNMESGKAEVEAGVIGNHVTVVARAQVTARKFEGIDIWESIQRNVRLLFWPALVFERL